MNDAPILEFDPSPTAILEPSRIIKPADAPEHAVICFFNDVITHLAQKHEMIVLKRLRTEIGRHPIWETTLHGKRLAIFHPGVGAPLAAFLRARQQVHVGLAVWSQQMSVWPEQPHSPP